MGARIILLIVSILSIGAAASYSLWHYASAASEDLAVAQFKLDLAHQFADIQLSVSSTLHAVQDLANFLRHSTGPVTAESFENMARPILDRERSLQGLSWNPVVPRSSRAEFESSVQHDYPDFHIHERDSSGGQIAAPDRDEFVPVRTIFPLSGNEPALGYNVASEMKRNSALLRARATNTLQSTEPITLVQEIAQQPGALIFAPTRVGHTEGFVVAVLRLEDAISAALESAHEASLGLTVWDVTGGAEPSMLVDRSLTDIVAAVDPQEVFMDFAGRWWRLSFTAGTAYEPDRFTPLMLSGTSAAATLVMLLWLSFFARHNTRLAREVNQRIEAESALTENQERLSLAIDSIAGRSWDWDIGADDLFFIDPRVERRPGGARAVDHAAPSLEANRTWSRLVHPDDYADVQAALDKHIENPGTVFEAECRLRYTNGEYRTHLNRGQIVAWHEDGTPARMVGLSEDVTERREEQATRERLEAQVRDTERIESLGLLAGGVAHDFNNLLVGVLSAADLARIKSKDSDVDKLLSTIVESAKKAAGLTKEMLTYAGRSEVALVPTDAAAILSDMRSLLASSINRRLKLEFQIEAESLIVSGDATQIRQIVMNLVTNAADAYGLSPGSIEVRLDAHTATNDELNEAILNATETDVRRFVRLAVKDGGEGMDSETARRAIEPFFSTKEPGRGLGLASVAGIVRRHRGALSIVSNATSGTLITVLIPADDAEPALAEEQRREVGARSLNILIVDDEEPVRDVTSGILATAGHSIVSASNGKAAIELLGEEHTIDLILMDASMPDYSGVETITELRARGIDLPVVLMSGFTWDHLEDLDGLELAGFLQKPFSSEQLLQAVNRSSKGATR